MVVLLLVFSGNKVYPTYGSFFQINFALDAAGVILRSPDTLKRYQVLEARLASKDLIPLCADYKNLAVSVILLY